MTPPPPTVERRVEAAWQKARPLLALMIVFAVAAMVIGPMVVYLLVVRGVREGRLSWVVLGALCGLPPVLLIVALVRRTLRGLRRPPAAAESPGDRPRGGDHV